jgi:hypothetical protein
VTITRPTTVFTLPALADIENRSRFCANAAEQKTSKTNGKKVMTV